MGINWSFSGGSLPAGATLTRASAGRYFDASGVLQSATTNTARFDHAPKTPFAQRGLLYEPAVTNYAQYTETMSSWYAPYQVFLGTPAGTAPDGSSSFAFWSDNFAYDSHSVNLPLDVLSNGDAPRASFFVENPNWPTEGAVYFDLGNGHTDGSQTAQVGFNVTTGTLGSFQLGNGSGTSGSGVMVDCGGGTFWVSLKFGDTIVDNTLASIRISSHTGPGDAVSGFNLWGVNLKKTGTEFDSYVANSSSGTSSRAADVLNITLGTSATQIVDTFDDASTQTITGLSAGSYNVSTTLIRPWTATIADNSSGGGGSTGLVLPSPFRPFLHNLAR